MAKETQIKNEVKRIKSDQIFVPQKSNLFAPELVGLAVLVASSVMRAFANTYEQVLEKYT